MRFPTMWYVRPAKPHISLRMCAVYQSLCKSLKYSTIVKLLTGHHLEFLSLKGGCRGSFESTFVKMSNCWKSRAAAYFFALLLLLLFLGFWFFFFLSFVFFPSFNHLIANFMRIIVSLRNYFLFPISDSCIFSHSGVNQKL